MSEELMRTGDFERRVWMMDGLQVRAAGEAPAQKRLVGLAAVYGQLSEPIFGMFREIIEPGAFAEAVNDDVRALWNHDARYVLGRTTAGTLRLRDGELGLEVEIFPPDTQWARDLLVSIERGDVTQMSFGWVADDDWWEEVEGDLPIRHITRIRELRDVSPVTYPAYPQTVVAVREMCNTLRARRGDKNNCADDAGLRARLEHRMREIELLSMEV